VRLGQFRIALQTGSTAHFADVAIEFSESRTDTVAVLCSPEVVGPWAESAIRGATSAIQRLRSMGVLSEPAAVQVVRLIGTICDTDDVDVSTATYVATIRAVLPPSSWPGVRYIGGKERWEVIWPASSEGA